MLKVWGRNTSSNVQKTLWALAEMQILFERIDAGDAFGKTTEPADLAMNPNTLVPTLEEEDGFTLWESNSIVRYHADKQRVLEPADLKARARAQMWMDWQLPQALWFMDIAIIAGIVRARRLAATRKPAKRQGAPTDKPALQYSE
jgi:glutathione S-transferase